MILLKRELNILKVAIKVTIFLIVHDLHKLFELYYHLSIHWYNYIKYFCIWTPMIAVHFL